MKHMHVVSHTHWDREWYQPYQLFRLRQVDLMDHLLAIFRERPDYRHFHLDGQTVILADYLELRPEMAGEIRDLVRSGKLAIGPFFVLSDLCLTSGESLIRNLLLGHRQAAQFGPVCSVGYIPDQFGSPSQMPQILRSFGLANAVVGRGIAVADVPVEFEWVGPDGSRVLTSLLASWYNNLQRVPADPEAALAYILRARDSLVPYASTPHLLLMNGVDHLEPQSDLPEILAAAAPQLPGDSIAHGSLTEYFAALRTHAAESGRPWTEFHGELRQQHHRHLVLNGTLSARVYLKQRNHQGQILLERWAEPWSAFAWLLTGRYPEAQLWEAWRQLMLNHPHDSICGCSIDPVHREMLTRFDASAQIAEELTRRSLLTIAERVDTPLPAGWSPAATATLLVWNPLQWSRDEVVTADLDFPPDTSGAGIELVDLATGECVAVRVDSHQEVKRLEVSPVELPKHVPVHSVRVQFLARAVPPFGYRAYAARRVEVAGNESLPDPTARDASLHLLASGTGMANRHLQVEINPDGTVSIEHLATGRTYRSGNLMVDGGEAGDEYLYQRPLRDQVVRGLAGAPAVSLVEPGPDRITFRIDGALRLPADLTPDRQGRTAQTVDCPLTTWVSLDRDGERVDFRTRIDNRARSHRLQVWFPTDLACEFSQADAMFDLVRRPVVLPESWQSSTDNHPLETFADLSDGRAGFALVSCGMAEYEVSRGPERALGLTLLRTTEFVDVNSAFEQTPDAQMPGVHEFSYSAVPHMGDCAVGDLYRLAYTRCVPLRATAVRPHEGTLPPAHSFLAATGGVLSGVKRTEAGDGLLVRAYNPGGEPSRLAVTPSFPARAARLLTMAETPVAEPVDGAPSVPLAPHQIQTLALMPERAPGAQAESARNR